MDCLPHFHAVAIHADAGFRGDTPGVGILCRENYAILGAGVFSNSIGKVSKYAAIGVQPIEIGSVKVGAYFGVVDGYVYNEGKPFVFGAGFVSWRLDKIELNLSVIPLVEGVTPFTVGFSFTWRN